MGEYQINALYFRVLHLITYITNAWGYFKQPASWNSKKWMLVCILRCQELIWKRKIIKLFIPTKTYCNKIWYNHPIYSIIWIIIIFNLIERNINKIEWYLTNHHKFHGRTLIFICHLYESSTELGIPWYPGHHGCRTVSTCITTLKNNGLLSLLSLFWVMSSN